MKQGEGHANNTSAFQYHLIDKSNPDNSNSNINNNYNISNKEKGS